MIVNKTIVLNIHINYYTVTSPLTPAILAEASRRVVAAAEAAENRKHTTIDPKCAELGWRCVPLAVETYCNWARRTFALLVTRLAFGSSSFCEARVISDMFGKARYHPG